MFIQKFITRNTTFASTATSLNPAWPQSILQKITKPCKI